MVEHNKTQTDSCKLTETSRVQIDSVQGLTENQALEMISHFIDSEQQLSKEDEEDEETGDENNQNETIKTREDGTIPLNHSNLHGDIKFQLYQLQSSLEQAQQLKESLKN